MWFRNSHVMYKYHLLAIDKLVVQVTKEKRKAKIRNLYNQITHPTLETKMDGSTQKNR